MIMLKRLYNLCKKISGTPGAAGTGLDLEAGLKLILNVLPLLATVECTCLYQIECL